MVDMEGIAINGSGESGGDDGIMLILVGGVIWGTNVEGIGLCHYRGGGRVVDVGEMGVTMRGGARTEVSGVV